MLFVGTLERQQRLSKVLDRVEPANLQQVFLPCPVEPPGTAVALGRPHEGRGTLGAEEADFALEVAAHVPAAMIMADLQPLRDILAERAVDAAIGRGGRVELR